MKSKIRKWKMSDAEDLAHILSNKKILNNLRDKIPYPYTVKHAKEFIASVTEADPNDVLSFAIVYGDAVVGCITAYRQQGIYSRSAEMGYYVAEEYWNKGIASNAIKLLCEYVFGNTDIVRVYAGVYANNVASCKALEKADIPFEGLLKKYELKLGKPRDVKMYAITKKG